MREVPNVEFNIRKMVTLTIVSAVKKKKRAQPQYCIHTCGVWCGPCAEIETKDKFSLSSRMQRLRNLRLMRLTNLTEGGIVLEVKTQTAPANKRCEHNYGRLQFRRT